MVAIIDEAGRGERRGTQRDGRHWSMHSVFQMKNVQGGWKDWGARPSAKCTERAMLKSVRGHSERREGLREQWVREDTKRSPKSN